MENLLIMFLSICTLASGIIIAPLRINPVSAWISPYKKIIDFCLAFSGTLLIIFGLCGLGAFVLNLMKN